MQIRIDDKIKVIELARALAEVGLTIRSRDGEAVIERGRMEPLPARPDLPAFLQRQA